MMRFSLEISPGEAAGRPGRIPRPLELFLGNGLRAFLLRKEDSPLVATVVRFCTGSHTDPPHRPGLTELTARMLARGTEAETAPRIARRVDRMAASLDLEADHEAVDVSIETRHQDHEAGLRLLAELIRTSTFPRDEMDKVVEQMISELGSIEENPASIARLAFRRALYGDRGYGRPILGRVESLKAVTREEVIAHARAVLVPRNALLVSCGAVGREEPIPWIRGAFEGWSGGGAGPAVDAGPSSFEGPAVLLVDRPDFTQVAALVGYRGVSSRHPDRLPVRLASVILGGASSSRLFRELRSVQGLSYDLGSAAVTHHHAGEIRIGGATRKERVLELLSGVLEAVERLHKEPPTDPEVARAAALYRTDIAGLTETGEGLALLTAEIVQLGQPRTILTDALHKLTQIDGETIRAIYERYFSPERRLVVLVGPVKSLAPELRRFGRIVSPEDGSERAGDPV